MKSKKGIVLLAISVLIVGAVLGGLCIVKNMSSKKEFVSSGYILVPSDESNVTTEVDSQYYFDKGDKYKEKYNSTISFKDKTGSSINLPKEQFIHYSDSMLGSFTKGALLELDNIGQKQFSYYSLTKNTYLVKSGNNYTMTSRGETVSVSDFVWKISDADYMIVSPKITLSLGSDIEVTLDNYAQIKYVDNGIVRIVHQQGTYQTVAAEATAVTAGGARLNLVAKNFYVEDEPVLSLDSIALDDESYLTLDENEEAVSIPTFNVENGKDGASGETGESGEAGEDGDIGDNGTAGDDAPNGADGNEGTDGFDGVEGNSGIMGYDGEDGADGEDAVNEHSSSNQVPTDVLSRPTVTVDQADGYDVTSNSASMLINMSDNDGALVNGSTVVELYDRKTMQKLSTEMQESSWGSALEETGSLEFMYNNLTPDTEYLVIVKGSYYTEEGGEPIESQYFSKTFSTEPLGISLEKYEVGEDYVKVLSKVSATNVASYDIVYYSSDEFIDANIIGTQTVMVTQNEDGTIATTNADCIYTLNADGPRKNASIPNDIASNTYYYAELANVITTSGQVISTGSVIYVPLKTLKAKPYEAGTQANKTYITAMMPTISSNETEHTVTVHLNAVTDEDNGVREYVYEVYSLEDYDRALQDLNINPYALDEMVPLYTKTTDTVADQTFSVANTVTGKYVARVVALFEDNVKEVEYATYYSAPTELSSTSDDFSVRFVNVNKTPIEGGYPDQLHGYIEIVDKNEMLVDNISVQSPMYITFQSEYKDYETIEVTSLDDTSFVTKENGIYVYEFLYTGLRAGGTYSLVLTGPMDSDDDGVIVAAEKVTYLAGYRGITTNGASISMSTYDTNVASTAFSKAIYLTYPETAYLPDGGREPQPDDIPASFYKHEVAIFDNITFRLYMINENGVKTQLGNDTTIYNTSHGNYANSSFVEEAWVERASTVAKYDGSTYLGLVLNGVVSDSEYVLSPTSFGLTNHDSRFYSGSDFMIQAIEAVDYAGNTYSFLENEDYIIFGIESKHVQSETPYEAVELTGVTYENANSTERHKLDSNVHENNNAYEYDEDTVVGIRVDADYSYKDIEKIRYYIYEVDEGINRESVENLATTNFYDGKSENGAVTYGNLVMYGVRNVSVSGKYTDRPFELYFADNSCYQSTTGTEEDIVWYKADKTTLAGAAPILTRGKAYYVRYEVESDSQKYDCNSDGLNDTYPYCTYSVDEAVPDYRSPILIVENQKPHVYRYPYTSDANSMTWKYYVYDLDKAIEGNDVNGVVNFYYGLSKGANTYFTPIDVDYTTNLSSGSYFDIRQTGLTDKKNYSTSIKYKLFEGDGYSEMSSSELVTFNRQNENAPTTGISLKGMELNNVSGLNSEYVTYVDGKYYEKAIVNESGYRYKFRLCGKGIYDYVAYRVVFTACDNAGNALSVGSTVTDIEGNAVTIDENDILEVTYDPVYVKAEDMEIAGNGTPYANLYLEASALAKFDSDLIRKVKINVYGYFDTNVNGFKDYNAIAVAENSEVVTENGSGLYSIRENVVADADDKIDNYYYYNESAAALMANKVWSANQTIARKSESIFVPGATGQTGAAMTVSATDVKNATMYQRYPVTALSLSGTALKGVAGVSQSVPLALDETGAKYEANYITVDKLKMNTTPISCFNNENMITLTENYPAIAMNGPYTEGANSISFPYKLSGAGANADMKLYAAVYKKEISGTYTLLQAERKYDNNANVYYYDILGNASVSDIEAAGSPYARESFRDQNIVLEDTTHYTGELKLRGLDLSTTYEILFFTYENDGSLIYLYSIDYDMIKHYYEVKTRSAIELKLSNISYTHSLYNSKQITIYPSISGDDGIGVVIYYKLYQGDQAAAIDGTTVSPAGLQPIKTGDFPSAVEGMYYYTDTFTENGSANFWMNPPTRTMDAENLRLGNTYTMFAYVTTKEDPNVILGARTYVFNVKNSLSMPQFALTTNVGASATADKLSVAVTVLKTDEQHAIVDDTYSVDIYSASNQTTPIETKIVTNTSNKGSNVVTFDNLDEGSTYLVKVYAKADVTHSDNTDAFTDVYVITSFQASGNATASVSASLTGDTATVRFFNKENFENVSKAMLTIFEQSDGTVIGSGLYTELGDVVNVPVTGPTPGKVYVVQVQYMDVDGNVVGTDTAYVTY